VGEVIDRCRGIGGVKESRRGIEAKVTFQGLDKIREMKGG
jgi:hypothetical protein